MTITSLVGKNTICQKAVRSPGYPRANGFKSFAILAYRNCQVKATTCRISSLPCRLKLSTSGNFISSRSFLGEVHCQAMAVQVAGKLQDMDLQGRALCRKGGAEADVATPRYSRPAIPTLTA